MQKTELLKQIIKSVTLVSPTKMRKSDCAAADAHVFSAKGLGVAG